MPKKLIFWKKGAEDLTIKVFFAIFIVIFVMFVIFTVLRSRGSATIEKAQSEYYTLTSNFLMAMLGSPCFAVGDFEKANWQITTAAFVDEMKLNYYNNGNEDLTCVENYNFLYSLTVVDSINGKRWRIGLKEEPEFAERKLSIALPVSIRYNSTIPAIHPGYAAVTAYIGNIPSFYGALKQACTTHETIQTELSSDYTIRYNNTLNIFYIGDYIFYPNFRCMVKDLTLEKGKYLMIIKYVTPGDYVEVVK